DLVADLLGRFGEPDHVLHVAGPLRRAHAHHVPLGPVVPAAAALAGQHPPRPYRGPPVALLPIVSRWARSCQRPPRSRARSSRARSQISSESSSTPSRSKTTASITAS